ncbi:MAG: type II toxin-antitoxin system VapC family toxin [Thermomicrobiales bacterium]
MTVLIDSDLTISGLNGRPDAVKVWTDLADQGLAVSVVTVGEVLDGAYGSVNSADKIAAIWLFLSGVRVIDVTLAVVDDFAQLRSALRRQGTLIPDLDLLIAATARVHNLTLVTRNVRHFTRIPDLRLYQPSDG